jgi:hypothetical protein
MRCEHPGLWLVCKWQVKQNIGKLSILSPAVSQVLFAPLVLLPAAAVRASAVKLLLTSSLVAQLDWYADFLACDVPERKLLHPVQSVLLLQTYCLLTAAAAAVAPHQRLMGQPPQALQL